MSVDYVIRHAAPTLAGIKTGNLFPCPFSSAQDMVRELRKINQVLVPRGLRLLPLRREKDRALLYLFRPSALSRDLAGEQTRRLLRQAGYESLEQPACLRELTRRLRGREGFPHEIGLFLGYPPEDVAGFMLHRGRDCKCVGCWKVYGDADAARRQFAAYRSCTANYCRRRAGGASLERLTVTSRPAPS